MENGWGWVVRLANGRTLYACGRVAPELAGRFTSRNAFIYALELVAQILPLVCRRKWLPKSLWCWCDNEASKMALRKGYGKDTKINAIFSTFWSFIVMADLGPHWRRVTSPANIADPISRHDLEIAIHQGWEEIQCDWNAICQILLEGSKSMAKAQTAAAKLLQVQGFTTKALKDGDHESRRHG